MLEEKESEETKKENKIKKEAQKFRGQFAKKTLDLMTAGFGLVAALAWNDLIKGVINTYIKPLLGESSAIISQFIYAVLVTFLAVVVTYNLSKLAEKK